MAFGAFVSILPGRDGLAHISQICEERVQSVGDQLREDDVVRRMGDGLVVVTVYVPMPPKFKTPFERGGKP